MPTEDPNTNLKVIILSLAGLLCIALASILLYSQYSLSAQLIKIENGFVFPLTTTQQTIKVEKGVEWCYRSQISCHGFYAAADIGAPVDTPVVAVKAGVIVSAIHTDRYGDTLQLKGDDGFWYYYAHLKKDSSLVHTGDRVNAGQKLGVLGDQDNAEGKPPHLHFDVAASDNGFDRPSREAAEKLIDVQAILREKFLQLPKE